MNDVQIRSLGPDPRPLFVLDDVQHALLHGIDSEPVASFEGRSIADVEITNSKGADRSTVPYKP